MNFDATTITTAYGTTSNTTLQDECDKSISFYNETVEDLEKLNFQKKDCSINAVLVGLTGTPNFDSRIPVRPGSTLRMKTKVATTPTKPPKSRPGKTLESFKSKIISQSLPKIRPWSSSIKIAPPSVSRPFKTYDRVKIKPIKVLLVSEEMPQLNIRTPRQPSEAELKKFRIQPNNTRDLVRLIEERSISSDFSPKMKNVASKTVL